MYILWRSYFLAFQSIVTLCFSGINNMTYANSWHKLSINHRSKMKVFVTVKLTSNWHQLMASNWCCTLTSNTKMSTKIVFQPNIIFTNSSSHRSFPRHILDIILVSCVDVHMICAIWQQDVKIRSIEVPWYGPNVDVNVRFECPLGCTCGL